MSASMISVKYQGLKAVALRAVAMRPSSMPNVDMRNLSKVRVKATESGAISGPETQAEEAPKVTPTTSGAGAGTETPSATKAEQEMQSAVFFLLFWTFCAIMSACYFQLQGFKI